MARTAPNVEAKRKSPVERGYNPLTGRSLFTGEKTGEGQIKVDQEAQKALAVSQARHLLAKRMAEAEAEGGKAISAQAIAQARAKLDKALRQATAELVEEIQGKGEVKQPRSKKKSKKKPK